MISRRKLIILFVVLLSSIILIFAQSRDEFRRRYGAPENGAYLVRPGIVMTMLYSEDNQAREFTISPEASLKKEKIEAGTETMSLDTVSEIFDEIVPISQRGMFVRDLKFGAGCSTMQTSEYEKTSIHRALQCSSDGMIDRVRFAKIQKK